MNPHNTTWCHLNSGYLRPNVKNIHPKYAIVTVNNVTFLFVFSVLHLKEHKSHEFAYMVETLNNHKEIILEDLQELEKSICHEYHEIASDLSIQKAELNENSQKLTTKN